MSFSGLFPNDPGALVIPGMPLNVVSPDAHGASGNGVITPGSGTGGSISGTDDTGPFRQAMADADTLLAQGQSVVCSFGPKTYFLNSAPSQSGLGNSIVPLPTAKYTAAQLGAIGANLPMGDIPVLFLTGVPGQTKFCTARTDGYSATNGPASIMGGPTMEFLKNVGGIGGDASVPIRIITSGITFVAPDQPLISGLDKATLSSSHAEELRFYTTTSRQFLTGGVAPTNRPPSTAFALRNPLGHAMESRNSIFRSLVNGWGVGMVIGNHVVAIDVVMNWINAMVAFDDDAAITFGATPNAPTILQYIFATGAQYLISGYSAASGLKSLAASNARNPIGVMGNVPFSAPWTMTADFLDANNVIAGNVMPYKWNNLFSYTPVLPGSVGRGANMTVQAPDAAAWAGTATLVAGTVTVTTGAAANITATSRVKCGVLTPGGTVGAIFVAAQGAGTVTLKSTSATDTSVVWYEVDTPK